MTTILTFATIARAVLYLEPVALKNQVLACGGFCIKDDGCRTPLSLGLVERALNAVAPIWAKTQPSRKALLK